MMKLENRESALTFDSVSMHSRLAYTLVHLDIFSSRNRIQLLRCEFQDFLFPIFTGYLCIDDGKRSLRADSLENGDQRSAEENERRKGDDVPAAGSAPGSRGTATVSSAPAKEHCDTHPAQRVIGKVGHDVAVESRCAATFISKGTYEEGPGMRGVGDAFGTQARERAFSWNST